MTERAGIDALAVCTRQPGVLLLGLDSSKVGARLDAEASSRGGMKRPAGNVAGSRSNRCCLFYEQGPALRFRRAAEQNPENVIVTVAV